MKYIRNLEELREWASLGLTEAQIAAKLGMCWSTFKVKREQDPEIEMAFIQGRAEGIKDVANALKETALSGNVHAQKFYLTNRDRSHWSDRVEQAHTGQDGGPIQTEHTIKFVGTLPECE